MAKRRRSVKKNHISIKRKDPLLRYAAYAGILTFLSYFPLIAYAYLKENGVLGAQDMLLYAIIIVASVPIGVLFSYGFVRIGEKTGNRLLIASNWLSIAYNAVSSLYVAMTLYSPTLDNSIIIGLFVVIYGFIEVIFAFGLRQLSRELGRIATINAILAFVIGITFISYFLSGMGVLILLAATVTRIMLLFKAHGELPSHVR